MSTIPLSGCSELHICLVAIVAAFRLMMRWRNEHRSGNWACHDSRALPGDRRPMAPATESPRQFARASDPFVGKTGCSAGLLDYTWQS
jgi:hypothetical protein